MVIAIVIVETSLFVNVIRTLLSLDVVLRHFGFSKTLTRLWLNRTHIDCGGIRMPHDCACSTVTIRSSIWTAALHGDAARVHYLLHVSKRMWIFISLLSTQAVRVGFPVVVHVSNPVPVGQEGWKENKARCVGWWRLYPSSLFCAGMPVHILI